MSKSFLIIFLLIIFLYPSQLFSQIPPIPIEWEEISMADLKMSSYSLNKDASALILCDYGETKLNNDFYLVFTRHLRIKILKKSGFDWGTQSISFYSHKGLERIGEIEGITYSLNNSGEIIKNELDSDDIYEEEVNDKYDRVTFTMPNLQTGCIIDIKYSIISESLYIIKDWTFQHNIPTRWSEYRVLMPTNIAYAGVSRGYEKWEIRETIPARTMFSGQAESMVGSKNPKCNLQRWVVKDAPALKDVPYISTIDDYVNKVELQLSGYAFRHIKKTKILGTWEGLVEELVDSESFYEMLDVTGDVEDLADTITTGLVTNEEKMQAIYNWVKNSIVWDGKNRVYSNLEVDEVIEYKKGNSSEINFLLLSLLKSKNIEGYPVILSTRNNGIIQTSYPIASQFNYVISKIIIGNKTYFLDATNPLRPIDLLPKKVLSVKGLVIEPDADKAEWVKLRTNKKNITITHILASIDKMGNFEGKFNESYSEYRSLNFRKKLKSNDEKEFLKDLYDAEEYGLELDSITISNKDSVHLPLKINSHFSTNSYAQKNGDIIYINPLIIHRRESNPFKLEKRNFPVDYGYKRTYQVIINLTIPDDYEVLEKLINKTIRMNSNNLRFSRMMDINNHLVRILYKFEIMSSIVKPKYYQELKEFYSQMIDIQAEQLVVKKKSEHPTKNTLK